MKKLWSFSRARVSPPKKNHFMSSLCGSVPEIEKPGTKRTKKTAAEAVAMTTTTSLNISGCHRLSEWRGDKIFVSGKSLDKTNKRTLHRGDRQQRKPSSAAEFFYSGREPRCADWRRLDQSQIQDSEEQSTLTAVRLLRITYSYKTIKLDLILLYIQFGVHFSINF